MDIKQNPGAYDPGLLYRVVVHYPLLALLAAPLAMYEVAISLEVAHFGLENSEARGSVFVAIGAVFASCVLTSAVGVVWSLHLATLSSVVPDRKASELWSASVYHPIAGPIIFYWVVLHRGGMMRRDAPGHER